MLSTIKKILGWSEKTFLYFQTEIKNLTFISNCIASVSLEVKSEKVYVTLTMIGSKTQKQYSIKCEIPKEYPRKTIVFFEETDCIPKTVNRHFNPDKSMCLESPINFWKYFKDNNYYLSDYVCLLDNFIESDEYYQVHGEYERINYSHGIDGVLESLQEQIPHKFNQEELKMLLFRLLVNNTDENCFCVCGSKKKISDCHNHLFEDIKNIDVKNDYSKNMLIAWYPRLFLCHRIIEEVIKKRYYRPYF